MTKTILVVDDDADFLDVLKVVLQVEYKVVPCPDPTMAYQEAKGLHPDAILLDLVMPSLSGWEVLEQLEADPSTAGIPVIICTAALSELDNRLRVLRELKCQVLMKPFEIDELLALVADVVAGRQVS